MKLRLPRRRIWRAAIYLGALLLVLIAIDLVLVQMRRKINPGYDTTRIIGPLQADGSIDYLTAIEDYFSRGVTRENNAAPLILQAIGRVGLAKNQPEDGITDRLGMPHLPETGDYFVQYDAYCKQQGADPQVEVSDMQTPLPWPLQINKTTAAWLSANEKPLATILEATKRRRFFIPFNGGYRTETLPEILLPYLNSVLDVSRALRLRALTRLEAGDVAGCRQDILTLHKLARLMSQDSTMIGRLVGIRIQTAACFSTRTALSSGKIPATDLRAMARDLETTGDLESFVETLNICERYMVLDLFQVFARVGPKRTGELVNLIISDVKMDNIGIIRFLPIQHEQVMRNVNKLNDGALAALSLPTYPQRTAALSLWEKQVPPGKKLTVLDLLSREWPAQAFAVSVARALETWDVALMQKRLTLLALELAAIKAEKGGYPATLADISPDVATDVFSTKPVVYAKSSTGYTLYSVGPNMKDDRGQADDLAVTAP